MNARLDPGISGGAHQVPGQLQQAQEGVLGLAVGRFRGNLVGGQVFQHGSGVWEAVTCLVCENKGRMKHGKVAETRITKLHQTKAEN